MLLADELLWWWLYCDHSTATCIRNCLTIDTLATYSVLIMIFDASSASASAPSLFFFSFSMFANSLPRSQLIEQSSWQMFNWVPYQGSLAPSWFPLGLRCLLGPSSNRAQLPLDTRLVPHSSASFSFFVCNSLSTPSWHLLVPLSSLWPVPYWVLHTTMAARNQCPRGIWIPMYNWSWSFFLLSSLSLSSVLSSAYSLWPFVCSAAGKLFIILSTNACSSWRAPEKDLEQEQGMRGELN